MKRFLEKANLNPAFKLAQPLPLVTQQLRAAIPAGSAAETPECTASEGSGRMVAQQIALPSGRPLAGPLFVPRMHPFISTDYASVLPGPTFQR